MGRLCGNIDYSSINDIIKRGLHEYIDDLQIQLNLVGEAVHEEFFRSDRFTPSKTSPRMIQTAMS